MGVELLVKKVQKDKIRRLLLKSGFDFYIERLNHLLNLGIVEDNITII